MCGIVGIYHLNGRPACERLLKRMTDVIAHRGPDGEGHFVDGPLGLGHRRLAILDLSDVGKQPMSTADQRHTLSYNGEVYNYQELRRDLQELNWQFHSQTDTEVVLKAFAQWRESAIPKFNGMFAFAMWDRFRRELLLVRDRYGVKPVYYTWIGDTLLFASEIKAFLAYPEFRVSVDEDALLEYFTFQNFFTDRTLFANVRLLPAGCYLRVAMGRPAELVRYWDYSFEEPETRGSDEEYVARFQDIFPRAVRRNLVSDVPVGTYLSGGIDSGAITACAAQSIPYIRTFTGGFDLHSASGLELGCDERGAAEHMSYLFRTEHYEMVLKAGDMERAMSKLIWHMEEPRVGQCYPNYYLSQLASRFVSVVLAGTGGDELFGGYPWRYYRAVVNEDFENYVDKYYVYWHRLVSNTKLRELFAPIWPRVQHVWTRDIFRDVFSQHASTLTRPEDYINHSLYFEAKTFLHGLLVVEDKLSMAHGLESRVPFLDNEIVDFAMKVPVRMKLGNLHEVVRINENEPGVKREKYFQRTRDGKLLLRQAMSRWIPTRITGGVKQGFSGPDASWFKGESIDFVRRRLYGPSPIYQFLDPTTTQRLLDEHLAGRENYRLFIWSLLCFDTWCQTFL